MNKRIKDLTEQLDRTLVLQRDKVAKLQTALQQEYNKIFDDSAKLKKALADAENASMYQLNENGEVESWWRYHDLSDYSECKEYFENWVSEYGFRVDWDNECLLLGQGESIFIQDDTRRDNGVWLNGKCIIDESEYKSEDGEVNEEKRNELIEKYMERTGYFPGVFRVTQYGDVFPVKTQKAA